MISPDQYKDSDVLRLLLQGPSGSGKSILACQFPKPLVIDLDRNLGSALRWLRKRNLPLPVAIDFVDRDDKDVLIPMQMRYNRLAATLVAAQTRADIDTIVIDSGTILADVLIAETLRQQNKQAISDFKDGRQFWNFFAIAGRQFMATLSQLRKHVVLVVHEKTREDEKGNIVYPIEVAWPGQVGDIIGCFFTNVWRCESEIIPRGPVGNDYRFFVRTMPDHRYKLKNTLTPQVPPLFDFKWEKIQEALKV